MAALLDTSLNTPLASFGRGAQKWPGVVGPLPPRKLGVVANFGKNYIYNAKSLRSGPFLDPEYTAIRGEVGWGRG